MNNIGILGGDLRIIFLSQLLAEGGYKVYTYGIEKNDVSNENIIKCETITELCENCDNIISGIPFSRDESYIDTPFSDKKIKVDDTLKLLTNKKLITGAIKQELKEKYKEINIIDLMGNEAFTVLNVIPTVEGAIQVAMENTEFTIHDSNCLVLGFGRLGKLLSKTLKELGANVSCMARRDKDLSWIKALGYKGIHINDLANGLSNVDIIFNTVPAIVLKERELKTLKEQSKNVIVIELASSPGGVDLDKAKEYGIKIVKAQGLPGKVAPITAAKYIKETLEKII